MEPFLLLNIIVAHVIIGADLLDRNDLARRRGGRRGGRRGRLCLRRRRRLRLHLGELGITPRLLLGPPFLPESKN